jgi:hypothetical protein
VPDIATVYGNALRLGPRESKRKPSRIVVIVTVQFVPVRVENDKAGVPPFVATPVIVDQTSLDLEGIPT